jgi:hypothetical protein
MLLSACFTLASALTGVNVAANLDIFFDITGLLRKKCEKIGVKDSKGLGVIHLWDNRVVELIDGTLSSSFARTAPT